MVLVYGLCINCAVCLALNGVMWFYYVQGLDVVLFLESISDFSRTENIKRHVIPSDWLEHVSWILTGQDTQYTNRGMPVSKKRKAS